LQFSLPRRLPATPRADPLLVIHCHVVVKCATDAAGRVETARTAAHSRQERSTMNKPARRLAVLACTALFGGCATQGLEQPAPVPELKPGRLIGYLPIAERVDSKAILPPPPANPAETATDEAIGRAALRLRGTERWRLAIRDADVNFPEAAGVFSCAVGAPITRNDTPYLYQLLRRVASDAGYSGDGAKDLYKRSRPFIANKEPPCTPEDMNRLGTDSSYPSGHSSTGMAWSLVLAELAPDRAVPVLRRGQAFAESRVVCNMHWYSDTVQGRFVGVYSYSRLQASPEFQADMRAARRELAAVRARNLPPTRDCKAEADALGMTLPPGEPAGNK
jgi:acid phosphatase (class A)